MLLLFGKELIHETSPIQLYEKVRMNNSLIGFCIPSCLISTSLCECFKVRPV